MIANKMDNQGYAHLLRNDNIIEHYIARLSHLINELRNLGKGRGGL